MSEDAGIEPRTVATINFWLPFSLLGHSLLKDIFRKEAKEIGWEGESVLGSLFAIRADCIPQTAGAHSSSKLFILPNRIDLGFYYTYVTQVQVLLCQEIEPRTAENLALAVWWSNYSARSHPQHSARSRQVWMRSSPVLTRSLVVCGWDLAECGGGLAVCGWDLAQHGRGLVIMRSSPVWMRSSHLWMRSRPVWTRSNHLWMRSRPVWTRSNHLWMRPSPVWMRSCRLCMRSSPVWTRSSRLWMRSSRVWTRSSHLYLRSCPSVEEV